MKSETSQGNSCEGTRSMLTMQCAEIIQSVDNTMSRKRTGKINNWPPYSKIFQYIDVKCHKASSRGGFYTNENSDQHQFSSDSQSIQGQELRFLELIKLSPKRKCFDLLSYSLNLSF